MIHRVYALSSTTEAFNAECAKLRSIFTSANKAERNNDERSTVRISLPFKDQVAANAVRKQLRDLSHKIDPTLQPVLSKKLWQALKSKEIKPPIVNKQCVVYHFSCDLCDADYVGYTDRHIAEHKNSAIDRHLATFLRSSR